MEAQGQTAVQCRQNENLQEQNSNGTVSTQLGYVPGRLEAHGQTAVQCRQSASSQQQNNSRTAATQIGHAPGRLEAYGQTAVQCRQNEISQQQKNSSRAVLTQIGHEPGRLESQAQTAVQCRQNQNLRLQNSGTVSTQAGYAPVCLEAGGQTAVQCKQGDSLQQQNSSRAVSNQIEHAPARLEAQGQTAVQCRPSDSSQQQNNSSQNKTFQTEPREIGGSAQALLSGGLRGGGLYGLPGAEKIAIWHKGKSALGKTNLEQPERERILYRLAEICTSMMRDNRGRVGDVVRSLGGILVTPSVDPDYTRRYFGELKGFPKIDELITIVSGGVPVIARPSQADLKSALRYDNHRSAEEHLPLIWKKIGEDVRREKCLVIIKLAAHEIPNVRVLPLGAVVTHKVRVINDLSFDLFNRAKKGGLNAETDVNSVPPSLYAEAVPEFLTELVSLRAENPKLRLLMATTDVNDAYRNVRIDPNQAHNFCYTVGDLVVIDFRLTFGWTSSPGNFGVMASAAEHSHCNTDLSNVQLLLEGVKMMEHAEIVDRWEVGDPTPVPPDAKIRASKGGKLSTPFHTVVYVNDHGLIRVQQSDEDKSALVVSASLASDYVRLFGPGEPGETPILAPKKSSNWNTTLEFLGFVINSHTLEISVTIKKAQAIQTALVDDWPRCRRRATGQEVFSIAGKLWNLTYVIRAGKYFVWRLLRITDLHTRTRKKQSHSVELAREFHDDLAREFHDELLTAGESLGAPCFTAIKRPAKIYYLSDASFDAIGGFCRKLRIYRRYDLPLALPAELKRKAARRETCSVTINLLELVGMVLTAWVMHELAGDRPECKGDPILMRGDNFAAVTWANRCGGARDKRAGLMMRMLGRLEIQGGWRYDAKHIPGVQNTLADGISRWPRSELADRVRQLTNTDDLSEQSIGARGERLCEIVLQTKNIAPRHDNMLWEIMAASD